MLCKRHYGDGEHKFRFNAKGEFLKSSIFPRKIKKDRRTYPKAGKFNDTWQYIQEYFSINIPFKDSPWQTN